MSSIRDKFGRHHHDQLFRNSSATINGMLLDTLEIRFSESVTDKEKIQEIASETFSNSSIDWIAWPEDTRCTIGLNAGYYKLDRFGRVFAKHGIKFDAIRPFYSARLST